MNPSLPSLPADSSGVSEEWPLKDPASSGTGDSNSAGPRLTRLLQHAPRFPKLPAAESFTYAPEQRARMQEQRAEKKSSQEAKERERQSLRASSGADRGAADRDERMQDEIDGTSVTAASTSRSARSHRVPFGESTGEDVDEADSNPLYDSDEEKEQEPPEDVVVARAASPEEDASDESVALPHSNQQRKRAAATELMAKEDPLYDPHEDESDEEWMRAKIQRRAPQTRQQRKKGISSLATAEEAAMYAAASASRSSPHLSCPACFTPLCFDCQRHDSRPNLFRAMFVSEDVIVDKGRQVRPEDGTDSRLEVKYFAVLCKTCKTHVGVFSTADNPADEDDQMFHFFKSVQAHTARLKRRA
jgi:hypothetical protein